jgi:hypothetical protein
MFTSSRIKEHKANSINRLAFVLEMHYVCHDVEAEYVETIHTNIRLRIVKTKVRRLWGHLKQFHPHLTFNFVSIHDSSITAYSNISSGAKSMTMYVNYTQRKYVRC